MNGSSQDTFLENNPSSLKLKLTELKLEKPTSKIFKSKENLLEYTNHKNIIDVNSQKTKNRRKDYKTISPEVEGLDSANIVEDATNFTHVKQPSMELDWSESKANIPKLRTMLKYFNFLKTFSDQLLFHANALRSSFRNSDCDLSVKEDELKVIPKRKAYMITLINASEEIPQSSLKRFTAKFIFYIYIVPSEIDELIVSFRSAEFIHKVRKSIKKVRMNRHLSITKKALRLQELMEVFKTIPDRRVAAVENQNNCIIILNEDMVFSVNGLPCLQIIVKSDASFNIIQAIQTLFLKIPKLQDRCIFKDRFITSKNGFHNIPTINNFITQTRRSCREKGFCTYRRKVPIIEKQGELPSKEIYRSLQDRDYMYVGPNARIRHFNDIENSRSEIMMNNMK